jgi:hypothetical protein
MAAIRMPFRAPWQSNRGVGAFAHEANGGLSNVPDVVKSTGILATFSIR